MEKTPTPSLEQLATFVRAKEAAMRDSAAAGPTRRVEAVSSYKRSKKSSQMAQAANTHGTGHNANQGRGQHGKATSGACGYCGRAHGRDQTCPARGKRCNKCEKLNHFSTVCRSKAVTPIMAQGNASDDDDEEDYTLPPASMVEAIYADIKAVEARPTCLSMSGSGRAA